MSSAIGEPKTLLLLKHNKQMEKFGIAKAKIFERFSSLLFTALLSSAARWYIF
jgi:hypothetical protein